MSAKSTLRAVTRWARRARARRRARLASIKPVDEQLVDFSQRARRNGEEHWQQGLPSPRRAGGGGVGG